MIEYSGESLDRGRWSPEDSLTYLIMSLYEILLNMEVSSLTSSPRFTFRMGRYRK